ncbi:alpha/beta fold hydrolase [Ruegeria sp. EL01]|uniref:alpha/beta fold hydrolase n=1 Tax=Ruegeria sp. EL01 TaxID=2107578 RepID=UPI000EA82230|nr:alpha/beta hydrolase [Ruegeria sp. EL01]
MNSVRFLTGATVTAAILAGSAVAEIAEVNGANLYYEAIGKGPPILIMHGGLGLSHDYLRPYFDQLSATNTVVYYDHFGNGRSDRPDDYADMTFDRLTSDAAELMTLLGHDTFTLIGHSYGGFIGQEFATSHPDRLDGLVLINTVPAFDYQPTVSGPEENMKAFGKLFTQPMADDADWQATWNPVVQMYFHQWDPEVGDDLDARTVYEHRAWNAAGGLLGSFNTLEQLPNVQTRTLVVAGRHDGITPPEPGAERIATLMPNAELAIFEDSGHYPFIEENAAFFETLNSWLAN